MYAYYMVSKTTLILLAVVAAVLFLFFVKQNPQVIARESVDAPRRKPVYIDQPTVYLNEPITYTEWNQEISSSL